jgi:hypothetical protein
MDNSSFKSGKYAKWARVALWIMMVLIAIELTGKYYFSFGPSWFLEMAIDVSAVALVILIVFASAGRRR